ncbi:uncharacterized protein LOC143337715 [Chaetodon auriga]|uniref:uncharacterized protein LOC143337715 n=1 Tax=Chaetodon auriga TaxID=39042 RepID=UPI004032F441
MSASSSPSFLLITPCFANCLNEVYERFLIKNVDREDCHWGMTLPLVEEQAKVVSDELIDDHLVCYTDHLRAEQADMEICFRDFQNLAVPNGVVEPFQADVMECTANIQEHLDLQSDKEAQATFHVSGWCVM